LTDTLTSGQKGVRDVRLRTGRGNEMGQRLCAKERLGFDKERAVQRYLVGALAGGNREKEGDIVGARIELLGRRISIYPRKGGYA